jgi:hypothetical protein
MAFVAVLPFWPAVVANGLSGAFNILFFVPGLTLVQERAPNDARARVLSSRSAIMAVGIFVSYGLVTALTTWAEVDVLLAVMGLTLTAMTVVAAMLVPVLRER